MRAVSVAHTDRYSVVGDRTPGARVNQVRIQPPAGLVILAIRAGGGDGFVREGAGAGGVFDCDNPTSVRAEFAAGFDQEVGVAAPFQELGHLIDGPALGDARKVHLERGMLLAERPVEHLELLPADRG